MNAWTVTCASLVLGVALGIGVTNWQLSGEEPDITDLPALQAARSASAGLGTSTGPRRPSVQLVGSKEFNFGVMARGETSSHVFQIKNAGTAPLRLSVFETTCMCTDVDLPRDPVAPGETVDIVLHWRTKTAEADFRHSATLQTSDRDNRLVTLSIHGQITQRIRSVPADISFGQVSASEQKEAEVVIYGYRDDNLRITNHQWHHDDLAQFFDLQWQPLTSDQLAGENGAKSGALVKVKLKPGLPLGPINQKVHLVTNIPGVEPLEVALTGNVVSDISIIPPLNKSGQNLIEFGPVDTRKGARSTFFVVARRPDLTLSVEEVDPPDSLQVDVGQAKRLSSGKAVRISVTVQVPAGSRPVNRLASTSNKPGRIRLQTNHADVPRLQVYVSYAVGDFD